MIVTLTPNPSVDRTVFLDDLVLGSVNRSQRSRSEPSGKGVNVALALHAHDVPVRAVVTAGGSVGAQLRQMLDTAGLDTVFVPIAGEIRSNISLTQTERLGHQDQRGRTPVGPRRDRSAADGRRRTTPRRSAGWSARAACPQAYPPTGTANWSNSGTGTRVPVAVDTSGQALAESLSAEPDLVKPNVHELAELTGRMPQTLGDVIDAAQEVRRRGARTVLASLGGDGAILVDGAGAVCGYAPGGQGRQYRRRRRRHARRLLSAAHTGAAKLATALQWGAAAVQNEGTLFLPNASGAQVTIERHHRPRPVRCTTRTHHHPPVAPPA